jgi:hypothetical protein
MSDGEDGDGASNGDNASDDLSATGAADGSDTADGSYTPTTSGGANTKAMLGSFWNTPTPDSRGALVSISPDPQGVYFQGVWSLVRAAQDSAMALPSGGEWQFSFGGGQNDNFLDFYNGTIGSGLSVLTLSNVSSGFGDDWTTCGKNFTGSGKFASGMKISYQIGVACV